jgi:hypothetical protein
MMANLSFITELNCQHWQINSAITQQTVAQITQKPKGHNIALISKCQTQQDAQLKSEHDQPTIGLLLCRTKDKLIAEYALKGIQTPIGVSEYQLTQALPDNLKSSLPSIEEIELELARDLGSDGEGGL